MKNLKWLSVLAAVLTVSLCYADSTVAKKNRLPASSELHSKIISTVANNPDCKKLGDFYYELGNGSTLIEFGVVGQKYDRNTEIEIASASKWLFGAFSLEKLHGRISKLSKAKLQMTSGFTKINNLYCAVGAQTVQQCHQGGAKARSFNSPYVADNDGSFYYSGAHAQALAVQPEIGLATDNAVTLAAKVRSMLMLQDLSYSAPQLAGGAVMSADTYARFLQNIITNKYQISKFLPIEKGICANSKYCKVASTPAPNDENWWYGLHYWIEKDSTGQKVEAYSSAGLYGFYPWITADQKYYGIIAREDRNSVDGKAYIESARCGKALRKAFQQYY